MPKIKKKRQGFVLDMTPLVDVAFLLLTFFMFTAKFKSEAEAEQKFVMKRPNAEADTAKLPENDIATIKIAIDTITGDTGFYFAISNPEVRRTVFSSIKDLPSEMLEKPQIKVTDTVMLATLIGNTGRAWASGGFNKSQFVIDADKRIKYRWVERLMNVMRSQRATQFNFVTQKKQ